ncbi:hypothetical protein OWR21_08960 [Ralstonia sp. 1B3]
MLPRKQVHLAAGERIGRSQSQWKSTATSTLPSPITRVHMTGMPAIIMKGTM